jgi:hypothetical protein
MLGVNVKMRRGLMLSTTGHGIVSSYMHTYPHPCDKYLAFEGMARQPYESGWHSVAGLTPASLHSVVQWRGWPHRGSWRNSVGA